LILQPPKPYEPTGSLPAVAVGSGLNSFFASRGFCKTGIAPSP
jgi:hypothetical protein